MKLSANNFQTLLLAWFDQNGRKDLPWQQNKTPYRVWLSEIMLQQTQVTTVINYFNRFITHLPTLTSLASASEDTVLHLWTGLGYYTRARNLHRAAQILIEQHQGKFPETSDKLQTLPGIGRSTANAILAIALEKKSAILDGNVKRVLTRLYGIEKWPGEKKITDQLWSIAEKLAPKERIADYTQAMMDMGATLCVRSNPLCITCPFEKFCIARKKRLEKKIPKSKPKKILPIRKTTFLIINYRDIILLEKRTSLGVWKGLWSFPQSTGFLSTDEIQNLCLQKFYHSFTIKLADPFRHTFSHYHLDILPARISLQNLPSKIMDDSKQIWYNLKNPQKIGLPAPVKKLLRNIL